MEKDKPFVSVIMASYNGKDYIEQAINSVISQNYANWELIVVDDESSDNSREIINSFVEGDGRIQLVTQSHGGQSAARNLGASVAQGKYIAFLDQDDCYSQNHLKQLVKYLEEHDDIGMAYDCAEVIDKAGNRIYNYKSSPFPRLNGPPNTIFDCLEHDLCILPGTVMVRKELFLQVGGFDPELCGYEDDHLFVRLFLKTQFGRVDKFGLSYRLHGTNSSSNVLSMCKSRLVFHEKLIRLLPDNPTMGWYFSHKLTRRTLNNMLNELVRYRTSKNREASRIVWKTYKAFPQKYWKYRLVKMFVHPNNSELIFRLGIKLARRLNVMD